MALDAINGSSSFSNSTSLGASDAQNPKAVGHGGHGGHKRNNASTASATDGNSHNLQGKVPARNQETPGLTQYFAKFDPSKPSQNQQIGNSQLLGASEKDALPAGGATEQTPFSEAEKSGSAALSVQTYTAKGVIVTKGSGGTGPGITI